MLSYKLKFDTHEQATAALTAAGFFVNTPSGARALKSCVVFLGSSGVIWDENGDSIPGIHVDILGAVPDILLPYSVEVTVPFHEFLDNSQ